jgi:hypothetical protein
LGAGSGRAPDLLLDPPDPLLDPLDPPDPLDPLDPLEEAEDGWRGAAVSCGAAAVVTEADSVVSLAVAVARARARREAARRRSARSAAAARRRDAAARAARRSAACARSRRSAAPDSFARVVARRGTSSCTTAAAVADATGMPAASLRSEAGPSRGLRSEASTSPAATAIIVAPSPYMSAARRLRAGLAFPSGAEPSAAGPFPGRSGGAPLAGRSRARRVCWVELTGPPPR